MSGTTSPFPPHRSVCFVALEALTLSTTVFGRERTPERERMNFSLRTVSPTALFERISTAGQFAICFLPHLEGDPVLISSLLHERGKVEERFYLQVLLLIEIYWLNTSRSRGAACVDPLWRTEHRRASDFDSFLLLPCFCAGERKARLGSGAGL